MTLLDDIEVIGLGQASLDFLGRVPFFPVENEKSELETIQIQCGGPASTAMVTLARLGVRTSFLGSISDDYFGKEIVKGLKAEGVDYSRLTIRPGYTSQLAFIVISPRNANRTIFWHRGSVPPLKRDEVTLAPFTNARILHIDGLMVEAAMEAARQARDLGWTIVMDAGTMRQGSPGLVRLVDIVVASEVFAEAIIGPGENMERALEVISDMGPGSVVITLGERGSIGRENGKVVFQRSYPVEAVDTTGAGDVYHGGYIYGILQGWDMAECMRFASAVAAMKCRRIGARDGIPRLEEVLRFMKYRE
ncbi:MAG: sugar kinase [Desulfobacteraceae bacterium]|nr:MAG: sugar kinase [Desulfobacteraceae bacterium]